MEPRERVLKVFQHEIPDCVPVLIRAMDSSIIQQYCMKYDIAESDIISYWRDLTPMLSMKIDAFDFSIPTSEKYCRKLEDGKSVDPFGRISQKKAYVDGFYKSPEIWKEHPPLELANERDPLEFKSMSNLVGDRLVLFASLRGYFELTWEALSMATFGKATRKDRPFIRSYLDWLEKYTFSTAKKCLDVGIEFFSVTDDMGYKNGTITHVDFYKEEIFPRYQRLVDMIHKQGGNIYLHSEGNITDLLESIVNTKFDGVQALTKMDGVNLAEIKSKWGDKIALLGTLSHSPLLDSFSLSEINAEIQSQFRIAGANGGLMMGPSAAIDKQCKIENVLQMVQSIHNCRY